MPPILTRTLDPIFAIAVGTTAYYTHERKIGRKEGHTLNELVSKRYHKWMEGK